LADSSFFGRLSSPSNSFIDRAALRPAPIARITVVPPVTAGVVRFPKLEADAAHAAHVAGAVVQYFF
jgi:hypothetical protein